MTESLYNTYCVKMDSPEETEFAARTDALLERRSIDAILASSYAGTCHLGGTDFFHLVWPVPEERVYVIWGADGNRRHLVPDWCAPTARENARMEIATWAFPESPVQALARNLEAMGLAEATIGVEMEHLTVAVMDELATLLPELDFVRLDEDLVLNRVRKRPEEVERMRKASRAAEIGMAEAIANGEEGMTEKQFSALLKESTLRAGADRIDWLALRWIDTDQDVLPGDEPIGPGEVISIEMGCSVGGYLADVQRTIAVPPAPEDLVIAYRKLSGVHERTMDLLKVGRRYDEVNRLFLEDMAGSGLEMWSQYHLGHSVGIDVHEGFICSENDTEIVPQSVFAIEPVIETPTILAIEDIVLVTEDGPEVISSKGDWTEIPLLGQRIGVPR